MCWLIREGLDTEKALRALFGLPAVRFRVVDRDQPGRLLTPWDDPADRNLARRAQLEVFGTVAHALGANKRRDLASPGARWFRTGPMDGFEFLEEILAGRRRWYRPKTLGHKTGLWALKTDVASYYAARQRVRALAKPDL